MVDSPRDEKEPQGLLAGLISAVVNASNRVKTTWLALAFLAGFAGDAFGIIGKVVDLTRWPAVVDSRLDILDETATEIPPLKADIILLKEQVAGSETEIRGVVEESERLANGQFRLTIRIESIEESLRRAQ
jgi:hypothetical protein